jgi:hypothetical protein
MGWILLAVVVVAIWFVVSLYNRLVGARNGYKNAFAQIDVQLTRRDDPLVAALKGMGEPVFVVDSNPTAERIARLIHDVAREQGLPVSRVTVWETPTSWAAYGDE